MGKHNGKARRTGLKVGAALVGRIKQGNKGGGGAGQHKHTTDTNQGQSILERSDLDELMAMADLAERDFAAERGEVIVISSGNVDPRDQQRSLEERLAAEARLASRLKIPRRPEWTSETTPDQLDAQERASFLEWRRGLAAVEEEEKLVLTPFERNLEVWRQLWRVVERSHIVCQVVDARDPLLYWSEDLSDYCHEVAPSKASYMIMNKADLLPTHVRHMWADYFDSKGVEYIFWSAAAAAENQQKEKQAAALAQGIPASVVGRGRAAKESKEEERVRVVDEDELLQWMEDRAAAAVQRSEGGVQLNGRYMVGLVGYPNVGKSSTINALFGAKKAAVGPTPGKTKHFQTLNVSPTVCLCDCPGLVFPRFAAGKAEMVAAGVIPIDRLTDIRPPCDVVTARCGRWQLENIYGIRLPAPQPQDGPGGPPTAAQTLRALALSRGWALMGGLPDEVRAGRLLLKDYTTGKLLHCTLPPASSPSSWTPEPATTTSGSSSNKDTAGASAGGIPSADGHQPQTSSEDSEDEPEVQLRSAAAATSGQSSAADAVQDAGSFDEADLQLLQSMDIGSKQKKLRADHKFHKKIARSKGDRGQAKDGGGYDGAAMNTGKKGGLVRVAGY